MTRHGKCETCRRRKVKCDEKWPTCGQCNVKRRPCHYVESVFIHDQKSLARKSPVREARTKLFEIQDIVLDNRGGRDVVTLRLKRHHKAKAGQGEFLIFEPVNPLSPTPPLLDPQTMNSVSLGSIFGYEALDLSPLGPWVKLGWPTSGTNPCLELASRYALQSMIAFQHSHSEESLKRAGNVGLNALQSLQLAIETCQTQEDVEALIVAIMLHYTAEHFMGIATWRYIPHLQGVCHLITSFFKDQAHNATIQNVVGMICDHEIVASMHFGEPSQLEAVARPQVSLDGVPQLDVALRVVEDLLIKLPRLVCLVRDCGQDRESVAKAVTLANELYDSEQDLYVRRTVATTSWTTTALNSETKSPTGSILDFDSISSFVLAVRYYLYRLFLGGLLITLSSFYEADLSLGEAEHTELSAATSLAECLDFALRPCPAQSLKAMAMILPLELSIGVWQRLREREELSLSLTAVTTSKYRQAVQMMDWCIENVQDACLRWRAGPIPRNRMEAVYGVFVGGPLIDDAYDYQKDKEFP